MITGKQKKFIKKNIKKLSLGEIAGKINLSTDEIKSYLKNKWKKEKYIKYSQKSVSTKNINIWYVISGLIFLCLIVYVNGLGGAFVSDDINWIPNNPNIGNFKAYFQAASRPAIWIIFYLVHAVGFLSPFFYRLPNLLFHMGNTVAIFFLINKLINQKTAIFASLIFAVHPILVESVTWIAGGSYAGYTFFFLLSFIYYLLAKNNIKLYFFTILFFLISLSFSEKAIVLFLIFPLYEIAFGSFKKMWKFVMPFLVIGMVATVAVFSMAQDKIAGLKLYNYVEPGLDNPFLKIPVSITEYLRLMFWPNDLSLYRSELSFSSLAYLFRLGIFLLILTIILIAYLRRNRKDYFKHIFFWLSFFIITLLPVLTPYRFASTVAERYVYMGSIGIFTVFSMILDILINKSDKEDLKIGIYVIFGILIISLSIRTIIRNNDWKSEDNLWVASARVSPNDPNVLLNLGDMYGRHQDYQKAIEVLNKAIKTKPDYADAYHNMANVQTALFNKNSDPKYLDDAINNFQLAIKYNPTLWQSHQALASIYYYLKEYDKALENINNAIKINPTNLNLQQNLDILKQI